jgi:hypothetical protein
MITQCARSAILIRRNRDQLIEIQLNPSVASRGVAPMVEERERLWMNADEDDVRLF